MKKLHGFPNRDFAAHSIWKSNGFEFELIPEYGKLPEGWEYVMYSDGSCDADDNLYLLSRSADNPIVKLDDEGNFVKGFGRGLFKEVHGIFTTDHGTVMCTDTGLHVVREIDVESGEVVRDFGKLGQPSDSGYEQEIWRRLQREGKIVATDLPYEKGWTFWMAAQTIRRAAPPFNRPTGVCIAPDGEIFVSDGYGNAAIHHFSKKGELIKTWGGPGDEPGKFYIPHAIYADRRGRVWVADREANSLHIFDAEGNVLGYMNENLYQPTALWADDTYVYVAERGGGLTIIDADLQVVSQLGFYNSSIRAHGMCGNSKGEIFLMPLGTYDRHFLMKLIPVRKP